MNKITQYLIVLSGVLIIGFLAWYFSNIVAYLLVSAVLSLMAKPLVDFLSKLHIANWKLPRSLCAAAGLLMIWLFFFLIFYTFIPPIASNAQRLSLVDVNQLVELLTKPLQKIEVLLNNYLPGETDFHFKDFFARQVSSIFDINMVRNSFGSITNFVVSMAVAIFSISFITFFFLKEESLFTDGIIILFPAKYEASVRRALYSSTRLLVRYFIGVILDMICVIIVLTAGLTIFTGLEFRTALIIGLIAGILNVIPYVGPVIASGIGILIAIATHLDLVGSGELGTLVFRMSLVFIGMKVLDDALFQPYIFSNSVNAHPLEIFLLILIAGSVAGVGGMLLAIPTYTILRVFAKEFFNNLRLVQKLTEKI